MRTLKILLTILIILAALILIGVAYIWKELAFQRTLSGGAARPTASSTEIFQAPHSTTDTSVAAPEKTVVVPIESFTVTSADLPPAQKEVMETLGLDDASITVTPAMVECALGALGAVRVAEIKNGAAPSLAEGLTLISCSGQ